MALSVAKLALLTLALAVTAVASPRQFIELDRLPKPLARHMESLAPESIASFKLSVTPAKDLSSYSLNLMSATIDADFDVIWKAYAEADLSRAATGSHFAFGFAYSRSTSKTYYPGDAGFPRPHLGMGLFLIVRALRIKDLPVGFEITRFSQQEKTIEFTYLKGGNTWGRQLIHFEKIGPGRTRLTHDTRFQSVGAHDEAGTGKHGKSALGARFRDRFLYPPIHERLIRGLHANILATAGLKAHWK